MSLYEAQCQVRDFMMAAGQAGPQTPHVPDFHVMQLRYNLMHEELQEFVLAANRSVIAGHLYSEADVLEQVADALADLMYVTIGTAVAFGIDIQSVWETVHESNMSKFIDGHRRDDGKWMKGPSWRPPHIREVIAAQMD